MHALHEGAVLEVPVLDDDAPARILQNMRDALRGARVGTGAADEKLRLLTGFVLKPGRSWSIP